MANDANMQSVKYQVYDINNYNINLLLIQMIKVISV